MIDIVYRYDPSNPVPEHQPSTPQEAQAILEQGNRSFAHLLDRDSSEGDRTVRILYASPHDLGIEPEDGQVLKHQPFAVVIGCADARVPTELILGQGANDLFVVRVAGNVLGEECLGSIDFALHQLAPTVRLVVVLGHTSCGAVTSAVDAFLNPANYLALASSHQLRNIVNQIFPAVRVAYESLGSVLGPDARQQPAFRDALIETSVVINAAMMASTLTHQVESAGSTNVGVVFGVYDLRSRHIGVPGVLHRTNPHHALIDPPKDAEGFAELAETVVRGPLVSKLLKAGVAAGD